MDEGNNRNGEKLYSFEVHTVADIPLNLPPGHRLPDIARESPRYDYGPWGEFGKILRSMDLTDVPLVDIGANIGDSIAHFRGFSDARVVAVEPSPLFFFFLADANKDALGNVLAINALATPDHTGFTLGYESGETTGRTYSTADSSRIYEGPIVTTSEIAEFAGSRFMLKSDTDGFDSALVSSFLSLVTRREVSIPIIMFEGATENQMRNQDFQEVLNVVSDLLTAGYSVMIFSNRGELVLDRCVDYAEIQEKHFLLHREYAEDRASCHYFDFIAREEI